MDIKPTILLCDDDGDFRSAMQALLASPIWNIQSFPDAESTLAHLQARRPGPTAIGCLILDMGLPGMSGLDLLGKLRAAESHLPVIMLTGTAEIPQAVEAMRRGALDYLIKPCGAKDLLGKIERAIEECRKRVRSRERRAALRQKFDKLSPREHEVLLMICQGATSKKVALDLKLSPKTIEVHRAHIMGKAGAESLAELVWMYTLAFGHEAAAGAAAR